MNETVSVLDWGRAWLVCWTGPGVLSERSGCIGSQVSFSALAFPSECLFLSVLLFALDAAFGSLPPRLGSGKVCWNKILLEYSTGEPPRNNGLSEMRWVYPRECGGTIP